MKTQCDTLACRIFCKQTERKKVFSSFLCCCVTHEIKSIVPICGCRRLHGKTTSELQSKAPTKIAAKRHTAYMLRIIFIYIYLEHGMIFAPMYWYLYCIV